MAHKTWKMLTRLLMFLPVVWVIGVVITFAVLLLDTSRDTKSIAVFGKRINFQVQKDTQQGREGATCDDKCKSLLLTQ